MLKARITSARDNRNFDEVLSFISKSHDPFGRNTQIGHVTSTAFIVDSSREYAVLIHHKKLNIWLPPGGHCDGDSDVRRVAMREACEETGLTSLILVENDIYDIDIHTIPANHKEPAHLHFDLRFLFEADREEPLFISDESNDLRWVRLSEFRSYTAMPSVLVLAEKLETL